MFPLHMDAAKSPHLLYPSFTCVPLSGPRLHWRFAIWPVTWKKLHVPALQHGTWSLHFSGWRLIVWSTHFWQSPHWEICVLQKYCIWVRNKASDVCFCFCCQCRPLQRINRITLMAVAPSGEYQSLLYLSLNKHHKCFFKWETDQHIRKYIYMCSKPTLCSSRTSTAKC